MKLCEGCTNAVWANNGEIEKAMGADNNENNDEKNL